MSRDTDDVLALIDGALEDWSTSGDAMRWTPEAPVVPRLRFEPPVLTEADLARVRAGFRAFADSLSALAPTIRRLTEKFREGGLIPDEPDDPRERALAARRNRNTGPSTEQYRHRGIS